MKKKNLLFGLIAFSVLLMMLPINAQASFVQEDLDPVCFWLLDKDDDDSVTLDVASTLGDFWYLEYSLDGSDFNPWPTGDNPITVNDEKLLIYFHITNDSNTDNDGNLTFTADGGSHSGIDGYRSVLIVWNTSNFQLTVATPESCGDLIGPVPIPATVWIFGAGVIGILGIRRKMLS